MMGWHTQDTWQRWLRRTGLVLLVLTLPWALSHRSLSRGGLAAHAAPAVLDDEPPETVCGLPVVPLESVIDPTFGEGGKVSLEQDWPALYLSSVAPLSDGGLAFATEQEDQVGESEASNSLNAFILNSRGVPDDHFGNNGTVSVAIPSQYAVRKRAQPLISEGPGRSIVLSSTYEGPDLTQGILIASLREDGGPNHKFGIHGLVIDQVSLEGPVTVRQLRVAEDGRVVLLVHASGRTAQTLVPFRDVTYLIAYDAEGRRIFSLDLPLLAKYSGLDRARDGMSTTISDLIALPRRLLVAASQITEAGPESVVFGVTWLGILDTTFTPSGRLRVGTWSETQQFANRMQSHTSEELPRAIVRFLPLDGRGARSASITYISEFQNGELQLYEVRPSYREGSCHYFASFMSMILPSGLTAAGVVTERLVSQGASTDSVWVYTHSFVLPGPLNTGDSFGSIWQLKLTGASIINTVVTPLGIVIATRDSQDVLRPRTRLVRVLPAR